MNRFVIPAVIFIALAAVLFIGVVHSPDKSNMQSALLGKPAPQFSLPVLGDAARKVASKELAGRPWVLNVWGSWCPECVVEHPMLIEIARENRVPIIGLNWRDDLGEATRWIEKHGNPYAVIIVDQEGRTAIDFGVYGAPETFFIDAEGLVQYRHVGAMTREVWEREFVSRLPRGGLP